MDSENKIIIGLDAMGGDFGPKETVKGAVMAVNESQDVSVAVFGNEEEITACLAGAAYDKDRIQVIPTQSVIETAESPTSAIRGKKDSSMVVGLHAVRNNEADAFVSCGNTGALLVGGQVIVGRLEKVERPALAFMVPSVTGPVLLIDCGANVDARPEMLVQFAQMGSIYMENLMGLKSPRVGIINIGEEEEKGNILVKETVPLLKQAAGINYVGSIESRAITLGPADVLVCDAFVGNTILKTFEGVAATLLKTIKDAMMANAKTKIGALLVKNELKAALKEFSVEEYGGAPLLGLKHPVVKSHGNAEAVEIKNTILQTAALVRNDICGKTGARIKEQAEKAE
ncbi:MAG: phosphate acyltransferase PlsX [Parasporobacterium sp.]|nr:phosphate acyltransferase PlsX [Parasporobacterium sp.]